MQIYWSDNPAESAATLRLKARRLTDYVIGLNANAVSISIPFYQDTPTSSAVHADRGTPTSERLGIVLGEAARSGLRVTLRPLLDEQSLIEADSRAWRGTLAPRDRDAWFRSYGAFLGPHLALAARVRVATVVVGAELSSLEGDPRWATLVGSARTRFTGELGYAQNWDVYALSRKVPKVDRLGVDAYPPLDLPGSATVSQLAAGWRRWLDQRTTGAAPGVILYEVGVAAEDGAYPRPQLPFRPGVRLDQAIQLRWFTAACRTARQRGLTGLYFWKIDFHQDPARADPRGDRHDSFLGRAGERAIRDCFASWSAAR